MNEPAHTEAVQTDLPSPKPNRRRRLALRFAVLVVAISVLGAAYWFTRPPELVWWTSPPLGDSRLRAHMRTPIGWEEEPSNNAMKEPSGLWSTTWKLMPVDHTPALLKRFFPDRKFKAGTEQPCIVLVAIQG